MMKARKRCQRACDACKRRKERCDGARPCLLCTRRGASQLCNFTEPANPAITPRDNRCTQSTPSSLRYKPFDTTIATTDGGVAHFGSSSTLGCLEFVTSLISQLDLGAVPPSTAKLEAELYYVEPETLGDILLDLPVTEYLQAYRSFAQGIFDLYSAEELELAAKFDFATEAILRHDLLLAAAIGAQERGHEGDEAAATRLFHHAHNSNVRAMLRTPDLSLVRCLLLSTLYLLIVCKRNAALMQLGVATQAAYTVGLHRESVADSPPELRAWRCLRVLDVSSAAALGRPLMTNDHGIVPRLGDIQQMAIDKAVDLAGLQLCFIAQKVLNSTYAAGNASIDFARDVSSLLRDWADSLPDGFAPQHTLVTPRDGHQQLYWNHMTAAYHWTIILLTRPFLINFVLGTLRGEAPMNSEASSYVDACVGSAFHCVSATSHLLLIPNLGKKLFLVVNTTLVSTLVLCLAVLGNYSGPFPLDEGLQRGEAFLSHQAAHDPQAAQYLQYLRFLQEACRLHTQRRRDAEMKSREVAISAIFGQVQATPRSKSGAVLESDGAAAPSFGCSVAYDALDVSPDTPLFDHWQHSLGAEEVYSHILDLEPEAY